MNSASDSLSIIPITAIPEIRPDNDLVKIVADAITKQNVSIIKGDIIVFAQKIVSKAEGRIVKLHEVRPSSFAIRIASELNKDPNIVETILGETRRIVKMDRGKLDTGRLIVETRTGITCANAGVDASNVSGGGMVTLLPLDPDDSAKRLVEGFKNEFGIEIAVIITDTIGRPWRMGLTEIAIGCWGIKPLKDYRGQRDSKGYELNATIVAIADEIAGAAGLVMDKTGSTPVVIVRGFQYEHGGIGAKELIRKPEEDLFR